VPPQFRDEFLNGQSFSGVVPILKSLRANTLITKKEKVNWKGHPSIKLTGIWTTENIRDIARMFNATVWPAFMPRQCCIYLDEKSHWPHRIEWWGPAPPNRADALLLQMEFRNPKLNVVLTPDRVGQVFKYNPGESKVSDKTGETVEFLKNVIAQRKAPARR
jgi:hypothetical protein